MESPIHNAVSTRLNDVLGLFIVDTFSDPTIFADPTAAGNRDKVYAMLRSLRGLLDQGPDILQSGTALSAMFNGLEGVQSSLNSFLSDRNPGHFQTAVSQIENNVQPFFWTFVSPNGVGQTSEQRDVVAKVSEFAQQSIAQLTEQRDAIAERVRETAEDISKQQGRIEEIAESAARERSESAAAVARLEEQFAQAQTLRTAAFKEILDGQKEAFDTSQAGIRLDAEVYLRQLKDFKDEAATIVGIVGNTAVTGNYRLIADAEGKAADLWRRMTVGFFVVAAGLAIATFVEFWRQPLSADVLLQIVVRLLFAIVLTGPAIYTARESARHRTNSDRARQTELELASIGPFIELMPLEKKIELRAALAPMYFGKGVDAHKVEAMLEPATLKELLLELVKASGKK